MEMVILAKNILNDDKIMEAVGQLKDDYELTDMPENVQEELSRLRN